MYIQSLLIQQTLLSALGRQNVFKMLPEIKNCMGQLLESFKEVICCDEDRDGQSWDCIAISAADAEQKASYEMQIAAKLENQEIPKTVRYVVIADPPGPTRIGTGGATFHIMQYIYANIYGEKMYSKRIWIMHAGGSSKRLPNFSLTGKIFCPLPLDLDYGKTSSQGRKNPCTTFDLKLATTWHFSKLMPKGGIFISTADDIESFNLDGFDQLVPKLMKNTSGVIAVAHPATVELGTKHGVYCLPSYPSDRPNCWLSSCREILRKQSHDTLRDRGGTFLSRDDGDEQIYTDSMFWFGPELVRKMMEFAREFDTNGELYKEESCIYADFLDCLVSLPEDERHASWAASVAGSSFKRLIADRFGGGKTSLDILVLEQSFYHDLGTMSLYLENLKPSSPMFHIFDLKPMVRCCTKNPSKNSPPGFMQGVVTNSLLASDSVQMKEGSVMDNCIVRSHLICEENTIISHCHVDGDEDSIIINIPSGWLFHTAALMAANAVRYVTVAFRVEDELKNPLKRSCTWKDCFGALHEFYNDDDSLWSAKLFEAKETMGQSFITTWKSVMSGLKTQLSCDKAARHESLRLYSMEDILNMKHMPTMLEHKEQILALQGRGI